MLKATQKTEKKVCRRNRTEISETENKKDNNNKNGTRRCQRTTATKQRRNIILIVVFIAPNRIWGEQSRQRDVLGVQRNFKHDIGHNERAGRGGQVLGIRAGVTTAQRRRRRR